MRSTICLLICVCLICLSSDGVAKKKTSVSKAQTYQITPSETSKILGLLNHVRSTTAVPASRMKKLTANAALAATMVEFFETQQPNSTWLDSEYSGPTVPGYSKSSIMLHLTELPYFQEYSICSYWLHDTFNTAKPDGVYEVFEFRVNQALSQNCFNYYACSTTVYDDYKSCDVDYPRIRGPGKPCQGSGRYYGEYVVETYESFGCAATGQNAKGSPIAQQDDTFVCIVCSGSNPPPFPPSSDVPYETGPRGMSCYQYPDYITNANGLCIPSPL